jgi:hypothetical protein
MQDSETGECLLKDGHTGEHLVTTCLGYYLWIPLEDFCVEDGRVCDCEHIECYTYRNISDAEAQQILNENGAD